MRIKKLAVWDNLREWRFEPIYFSNLVLLVGVSGVGKTQILKGILRLKEIANGASLNGLAWDITLQSMMWSINGKASLKQKKFLS